MTALHAFAELNEAGTRIEVHFQYSPAAVEAIKEVPGYKFISREKGGPYWTIPLDIDCARRLREGFGAGLRLGDAVKAWGREAVRLQRNLGAIATAEDAELERLSKEEADWLRPYQRADIKMMAMANVINANQPGTGKTVEAIYAVKEAGLKGPHLVIAPITLHKDPWRDELQRHMPGARVFYGNKPDERRGMINLAWTEFKDGTADDIWVILNPDAVRVKKVAVGTKEMDDPKLKILSKDHKGNAYVAKDSTGERLFQIEWGAVILDEFHKFGLGEDRNTLFARAAKSLGERAQRRYAMSGTPMGGKPVRLWGGLNFIEPQKFSGKWKWAEQWLTNADGSGPVQPGAGTGIGGIIPGREEEFSKAHSQFLIRRLRKDALPGLPDKVTIDISCPMTPKQRKVYDEFMTMAEVAIEGGRLSANGVLAEYARAKQLANAVCEIRDGEVHPTTESGKLPILLARLDEYGVRQKDHEPGARAIVASESKRFVAVVAAWLEKQGLKVRRLDGSVTGDARDEVIDWYKEDSPEARTLVMTTQTGGVGLNLGMTGSIHILDETWNPDDQEQLEDRGMRNRTTALMVLYYRTEGSIQETIWEVTHGKAINNRNVMDLRASLKGKR